jgi:inhibitor of cysteine peptidase
MDMVDTVTLTDKHDGTVIHLTVGSRLVIRLEALPGAGYGWQIAGTIPPILRTLGQPVFEPSPHGEVGGPTMQVYEYLASASGSGKLELDYRRPWEKERPAERTFRVTVVVGEVRGGE